MTAKEKFVACLNALAREINDVGMCEVDVEDGEMAFILRKAADLIQAHASDDLK